MGAAYNAGAGVGTDKVLAYMWFDLAQSGGYVDAMEAIALLEPLMTQAEIEHAQSMAQTCVISGYSACGD